jgi:CCR4-NOT transcription complex subunit 1
METDRICFFFRLCTEACIELYQQPPLRTQAIEAYTKLIGCMLHLQNNSTVKVTMASQVLSVVVLVLAHHHENQNLHFNQKPFLKLLSSLFIELNNATNKDKKAHRNFITVYR